MTGILKKEHMSPEVLHARLCILCAFSREQGHSFRHILKGTQGHSNLRSTELQRSERNPGERDLLKFPLGELSSPPGLPSPWLGIYWFVPEDLGHGLSEKCAVWNANKLKFLAWLVR